MTINLMKFVEETIPGNWKNCNMEYKTDDQMIHVMIGKEFALVTPLDADTLVGRYVLERLGQ